MADQQDPNIPLNLPGGPTCSQRLWSEEVAIAAAQGGENLTQLEPSYEFSNGRRFGAPVRPL